MTLSLPNDLANDTTADALPVQQNYSFIEQYVNAEVITRDGAVGMQAPLLLVGSPVQPLHAATKAYVDSVIPIGIMFPYGGVAPPAAAWALCNGASLTTSGFPDLFAVIGYRFGGSGSNFLLPQMGGRMFVGITPGEVECDTVGKMGGQLNPAIAQHQHAINHAHSAIMSNVEAEEHTHWMGHGHTASAGTRDTAHNHGFNVNSAWDGIHDHTIAVRNDPVSGSAGSIGRSNAGGTIVELSTSGSNRGAHNHNVAGNTGTESANHSHAITVDVNNMSTGGRSAGHTHYINLAASPYGGNSGNVVQPVSDKVRPPYVVVSFIIRVM